MKIINFLYRYWPIIGITAVPVLAVYLYMNRNTNSVTENILTLNLIFLFIHQFEEYVFPGRFPRMLNSVMFRSAIPDSYPLNRVSAFTVNVIMGWAAYAGAVLLSDLMIAAIAVMSATLGNACAHILLFNIRGKRHYNPGMASSLLLFLPLSIYFFYHAVSLKLASPFEWAGGLSLGIIIGTGSIFLAIDFLKNKKGHGWQ